MTLVPASLHRPLAVGAVTFALAGLLVALVDRARDGAIDGTPLSAGVRQLQQLDAAIDAGLLRAQAGRAAGIEAVNGARTPVAALRTSLSEGADAAWGDADARARLRPLLDDAASALESKRALVDTFLAQEDDVRNAPSRLPAAGAELAEAARNGVADRRIAAELEEAAATLVTDAMRYLLRPDATLRGRMEDRDARLAALAPQVSPEIAELIEALRPHAQAVLKHERAGDELRTALAALPVRQKLDALAGACDEETVRLASTRRAATLMLGGYAALLLVALAAVAARLVHVEPRLTHARSALKRARKSAQAAQAGLAQAEKTAALGSLVPGVAREIDTPLAYVKGTLGVLAERIARVQDLAQRGRTFTGLLAARDRDPAALNIAYAELQRLANDAIEQGLVDELKTLLDDGRAGLDQIGEIVAHLKRFGTPGAARSDRYDVCDGLERTLVLVRNLLRGRIRVVKQYQSVPAVAGGAAELDQVLLSLVTCGAQAIPADRDGFLTLRTEMDDDKTVRIEIQDNGDGIANEVLPQLFDPLAAATRPDRGSGIGLATAARLVKAHGGAILVDTELGVGTVFTVLLPIERAEAAAADRAAVGQTS